MTFPPTNFSVLDGAGGRPAVGDIFEAYLAGQRLIGRVISTDAFWREKQPPKNLMLYVFHPVAEDWRLDDRNAIQTDRLLLPPLLTDATAWRRKYFRKVGNLDFGPNERLEPTTFRASTAGAKTERWVDEHFQEVLTPTKPSGVAGGMPYLMLDDLASDALGVPRASGTKPAVSWRIDGAEHWVRIDCEAAPTLSAIRALGHEPNGYFWSSLLEYAHPDLMADIESDPEAGSVSFYGSDDATKRLRPAVVSLVEDPKEIARLVEEAKKAGVELDD